MRNVAAGASAIDLKRGLDRGAAGRGRGAPHACRARSRAAREGADRRRSRPTTIQRSASSWPTRSRRSAPRAWSRVEEAKGTETALEVVEGMQFDRGYLSPYFVTDAGEDGVRARRAVHSPDRTQDRGDEGLVPLLEQVAQAGRPLLDHRRGHRGRGAGDAGRQQAARRRCAAPRSRRRASAIAARRCSRTSRC